MNADIELTPLQLVVELRARIAALERDNAELRAKLALVRDFVAEVAK